MVNEKKNVAAYYLDGLPVTITQFDSVLAPLKVNKDELAQRAYC